MADPISLPSTSTSTTKKSYTPQEAADLGLGWVDVNNPNYGQAGYVGSEAQPTQQSPGTVAGSGTLAPSNQPTLQPSQAPQVSPFPSFSMTRPALTQPSVGVFGQPTPNAATGGNPQFLPQQNTLQGAVQQALMGMLAQRPGEVSITDPTIAPQAAAYKTARSQAQQEERSALAERAAAQGLGDSGAMDVGIGQGYQQAGQDIAAFNAGLIGQEVAARRDDIQKALGLASQLGLADQADALRRELANLDAQLKTQGFGVTQEGYNLQRQLAGLDNETKRYLAELDAQLRREGYSTQDRLAQLDAAVRQSGIDTQGNLGALDAAIRLQLGQGQLGLGYAQLGTQNQQFYDQLGFNIGSKQSDLDQAILSFMAG